MIPVAFEDCFGWLHRAHGHGHTGAVMCGAFGQEGVVAYRGWHDCAVGLAATGVHVLRFDWPGTGDSAGTQDDPGRLAAWRRSVRAAVACLRSETGTQTVILIGLRLGAALALLEGGEIDGVQAVACLMPVVSGKTYLRELRLLTSTWRDANLLPAPTAVQGGLEVVGDRLTEETVRALTGLDLRRIATAPRQVLLMGDEAHPGTDDLAAHLRSLGSDVSRLPFPGGSELVQDSLALPSPRGAFERLWDWCGRFRSDDGGVEAPTATPAPAFSPLRLEGVLEEPFRFGPDGGLFGILCVPRGAIDANAPTVVMVNTGFGRRIGDGRMYVTLARRLASVGVASLRMDMAGFGDSEARDGEPADPYAMACAGDIIAAVDALARAGHGRPVLVGICSGAHAAFHASVADERVSGSIIVNLQKFKWRGDTSFKVENRRKRRPASFYLKAIGAKSAWRRLLRGEVAVLSIGRALLARPLMLVAREAGMTFEAVTGAKMPAGAIMRDFQALSARGTRVDLVYSAGDPGLSELARHVGRDARRRRALPNVRVRIIDHADHALLDSTARAQFVDLVVDGLRGDVAVEVRPSRGEQGAPVPRMLELAVSMPATSSGLSSSRSSQ